jgi:hypothetical protein
MGMLQSIDRFENDVVRSDPMLKSESNETSGPIPEWRT